MVLRECPLCLCDNQGEPPLGYSRGTWHLKRCTDCGFVYLENPATTDQLAEDFAWTTTAPLEKEHRRQREPLMMSCERRFCRARNRAFGQRDKGWTLLRQYVRAGSFLDVACGEGRYFRRMATVACGHGIELDPTAAARAHAVAQQSGGSVVQGEALACLRAMPDDLYTGVVLRAFLEHEPSPRAVLHEVRRVLRPGGCTIIQVPNYGSLNRRVRGNRWCGFRFPDHVNYFTPKNLRQMVEDAGFSIARFRWTDRLPTSDRMWLVARVPPQEAVQVQVPGAPSGPLSAAA